MMCCESLDDSEQPSKKRKTHAQDEATNEKADKTATKTSEEIDDKESYKSAMMCWESLDDSEQASKKIKTHAQDEATNDKADETDDKTHTKHTTNMGTQLNMGVDNDASTLANQGTLAKTLVYITNIPEGKLDHTKMYEIPVRTQANRTTRNVVP